MVVTQELRLRLRLNKPVLINMTLDSTEGEFLMGYADDNEKVWGCALTTGDKPIAWLTITEAHPRWLRTRGRFRHFWRLCYRLLDGGPVDY